MPAGWAAAAGAVVGGVATYMASQNQADAATEAANKQYQATQDAIAQQNAMYAKNAPYWTPYVNLGERGTTAINAMMPYLTKQFTPSDLQTQLAPNYQFMLNQGLGATRQGMNVSGGGSNINRASDVFAQNYAQNAYQTALSNFTNQRTGIYNTLASIANIGQQGAAGLSNLGTGTATNIANLGVGGAGAIGAGMIGAANAQAAGLTGIGNTASNLGMMYGLSGGFGSSRGTGGNSVPFATGDTGLQGPMYQSMLNQGAIKNADGTLSYA